MAVKQGDGNYMTKKDYKEGDDANADATTTVDTRADYDSICVDNDNHHDYYEYDDKPEQWQ